MEKLKGDSWQLRIGAVFMLIFGIGGIFYTVRLVIPLFTGAVEALLISMPLYLIHLALSAFFYGALCRSGFLALTKPQLPMKQIGRFSDGAWLLILTGVYQGLHLLYEGYLAEGMLIPVILAAVQVIPPIVYFVEKKQIAEDLRSRQG